MKQLWFVSDNKVELLDSEIPKVGFHEVKIKIAFAALCATDVHVVTMGMFGVEPPAPMGHEASGTIVELGMGTEYSGLEIGDKV